ncbi:translation initiation factor IF-2-like [Cricetulus griseus]|uniref:Translation initiation factor IF-2-like n=1 Tax=Cricetulus griseus TaxID=10029 RepID=A0A9J7KDD3_CRIGR|nr:translation initiation factor IF-2-like [Cricetulus griseus]
MAGGPGGPGASGRPAALARACSRPRPSPGPGPREGGPLAGPRRARWPQAGPQASHPAHGLARRPLRPARSLARLLSLLSRCSARSLAFGSRSPPSHPPCARLLSASSAGAAAAAAGRRRRCSALRRTAAAAVSRRRPKRTRRRPPAGPAPPSREALLSDVINPRAVLGGGAGRAALAGPRRVTSLGRAAGASGPAPVLTGAGESPRGRRRRRGGSAEGSAESSDRASSGDFPRGTRPAAPGPRGPRPGPRPPVFTVAAPCYAAWARRLPKRGSQARLEERRAPPRPRRPQADASEPSTPSSAGLKSQTKHAGVRHAVSVPTRLSPSGSSASPVATHSQVAEAVTLYENMSYEAGKMTHLLCKPEELSLNPQHSLTKLSTGTWEAEAGGSL